MTRSREVIKRYGSVVVLPSLIDNFPNACLEAMGLGKVVIGTVGTSFDELISEGTTGFLVSPNNPEALADKIISAWIHPKLCEIGVQRSERHSNFTRENGRDPLDLLPGNIASLSVFAPKQKARQCAEKLATGADRANFVVRQ